MYNQNTLQERMQNKKILFSKYLPNPVCKWKENLHSPKNLYVNTLNSYIHNSPKLETKCSSIGGMDTPSVVPDENTTQQ